MTFMSKIMLLVISQVTATDLSCSVISDIYKTAQLTDGSTGCCGKEPASISVPDGSTLKAIPSMVGSAVDSLVASKVKVSDRAHMLGHYEKPGYESYTKIAGNTTLALNLGTFQVDIGPAVDEDTLLDWFSVTKTVTSITAAKFVDVGALDLLAPVANYAPSYCQIDAQGRQVTPSGAPFLRIEQEDQAAFETAQGSPLDVSTVDPVTQDISVTDGDGIVHKYVHKHVSSHWLDSLDAAGAAYTPGTSDFGPFFFKLVPDYTVSTVIDVLRQGTGLATTYSTLQFHREHAVQGVFAAQFPGVNIKEFYTEGMALDHLRYPNFNNKTNVVQPDAYSGLINLPPTDPTRGGTPEDLVGHIVSTGPWLLHSPGERQTYDPDYIVLAAILKGAAAASDSLRSDLGIANATPEIGELYWHTLFKHMDMSATFIEGAKNKKARTSFATIQSDLDSHYAEPHTYVAALDSQIVLSLYSSKAYYGSGNVYSYDESVPLQEGLGFNGIISNLGDLAKWGRFLFSKGVTDSGTRLVSKPMMEYFMRGEVGETRLFARAGRPGQPSYEFNEAAMQRYGLGFYQVPTQQIPQGFDVVSGILDNAVSIAGYIKGQVGWFGLSGCWLGISEEDFFVGWGGTLFGEPSSILAKIRQNM